MSKLREMIDAIEVDNFDCARSALKASLADYMAGRAYISNEEIFGKSYKNPNKEEQELKAELTEAEELDDKENIDCVIRYIEANHEKFVEYLDHGSIDDDHESDTTKILKQLKELPQNEIAEILAAAKKYEEKKE